jgi:hypothetical protein
MLTYEELKNKPRELLAATSLKQDEFETLLVSFGKAYAQATPEHQTLTGQARQRRKGGGNKGKLWRLEDKLLLILVYEKTYPLQTMLGLQFGLSQGRVNEWIHRLMPILQTALSESGMSPQRDGAAVATSELAVEGGADMVIDGTERRRQRPQDKAAQKDHYSGKKSPHRQKSGVGEHA